MTIIAQRIKELRKQESLTQEQFGRLFGVVKATVSSYETGNSVPDDDIKKQICKHFGVSCDYLIGLTDYPSRHPITVDDLKAALFGNTTVTEDMWQDVLEYARFVAQRYLREKSAQFAKRLRIAMFKAKLNATELSKKAKIAASTIAGYVDGQKSPNPGDWQMQTLAKSLNVDLTWLESGEKEGAPFDLKEALFPDAQEVSDREWKRILDFAQVPYDERGFEDSEEMPFDASGHQTYRMDIAARGGGVKEEIVTRSELDFLESLPDLKAPNES